MQRESINMSSNVSLEYSEDEKHQRGYDVSIYLKRGREEDDSPSNTCIATLTNGAQRMDREGPAVITTHTADARTPQHFDLGDLSLVIDFFKDHWRLEGGHQSARSPIPVPP